MQIYSPIHQINFQSLNPIWVKRDDLIDPYISGNKWRKLKYILKDAQEKGKNHLVTFGGAYSNHLVATAAAAARNGLKATAFVRGEEVTNEMLLICSLFGMQLIFIDRESYKNKAELFHVNFENDENAYFIDEGGASEEAVKGCSEIINELTTNFDHIFCAAGTGTTAAGLLRGINQQQLTTKLHVIPVLKGGEFLKEPIDDLLLQPHEYHLHDDYHFGGYGKVSEELIAFMNVFFDTTGIPLDPVYTGKMFFGVIDLINKGWFPKNANVLLIHTGGLQGIAGMNRELTRKKLPIIKT